MGGRASSRQVWREGKIECMVSSPYLNEGGGDEGNGTEGKETRELVPSLDFLPAAIHRVCEIVVGDDEPHLTSFIVADGGRWKGEE